MTTQTDLQALVERIRALAEAKVVECHHDQELAWDEPDVASRCAVCHGTGQVPNPAFKDLLDVAQKAFWDDSADIGWWQLRNWEGMPPWALKGALFFALIYTDIPYAYWVRVKNSREDGEAAQVVIEWLESLPPKEVKTLPDGEGLNFLAANP